jgi:uncharacterized membrane protein
MMENAKQVHTSDETSEEQASMNNMDVLVGYILLIGVLVSVGLIIAGTLWNLLIAHRLASLFTISGENYFGFMVSSLRQLFNGPILPQLLISLGIGTLMFTPYLRVAASVIYFAFVARNVKYTIFTLVVFSILTYSLFLR